jgi:hypothetical protein
MSRNLSPPREATLSETLERRLRSYSIAAAAAGVGMLALVQPAEAEVVITHKIIEVNTSTGQSTVSIDINHDGIADFKIAVFSSQFPPDGNRGTATVTPLDSGAVVGGPISGQGTYASALKRDVMIGPFKHFVAKRAIIQRGASSCTEFYCGGGSYGNWVGDPPNRFLGVQFPIDGETHYGWVRMKVLASAVIEIESYAYETEPDTPICAREVLPCPAPPDDDATEETGQNVGGPSLGMLALGVDGLALWRREALAF